MTTSRGRKKENKGKQTRSSVKREAEDIVPLSPSQQKKQPHKSRWTARTTSLSCPLALYFEELVQVWNNDKRLPSATSRRDWALARNVDPQAVHVWFQRRWARARRLGEGGDGEYTLDVGNPVMRRGFGKRAKAKAKAKGKVKKESVDVDVPLTTDDTLVIDIMSTSRSTTPIVNDVPTASNDHDSDSTESNPFASITLPAPKYDAQEIASSSSHPNNNNHPFDPIYVALPTPTTPESLSRLKLSALPFLNRSPDIMDYVPDFDPTFVLDGVLYWKDGFLVWLVSFAPLCLCGCWC